jgi:hypothetical protein
MSNQHRRHRWNISLAKGTRTGIWSISDFAMVANCHLGRPENVNSDLQRTRMNEIWEFALKDEARPSFHNSSMMKMEPESDELSIATSCNSFLVMRLTASESFCPESAGELDIPNPGAFIDRRHPDFVSTLSAIASL